MNNVLVLVLVAVLVLVLAQTQAPQRRHAREILLTLQTRQWALDKVLLVCERMPT